MEIHDQVLCYGLDEDVRRAGVQLFLGLEGCMRQAVVGYGHDLDRQQSVQ